MSTPPADPRGGLSAEDPPPSRLRVVFYGIGALVAAYGALGLLADARRTHPVGWLTWFLGGVAAHDLLLVPAVAVLALAVRRVPAGYRALVQCGLFASATVTLVALPFVGRFGEKEDNPSALPLDYARGLAVVLAVVWMSVALGCVALAVQRRRQARSVIV